MWKMVVGYEGLYMVSDAGGMIACEKHGSDGRLLRERKIHGGCYPNGYEFVCLRKDGKNKMVMIHRLVADAFIPNISNRPCVNHKDGNKHNNAVSNLEWCTYSQNRKHAYDTGLSPQRGTPISVVVDERGKDPILLSTMRDCEKNFGFKKGWIQRKIRKFGNEFWFGENGHVAKIIVRRER